MYRASVGQGVREHGSATNEEQRSAPEGIIVEPPGQ